MANENSNNSSSSKKAFYFKNARLSALKVVVKRPKDKLDPTGAGREVVRFKPYYDMWKGDPIKVGYLQVDDAKVAKRVAETQYTQEIDAKEYEKAMKELRPAPIKVA